MAGKPWTAEEDERLLAGFDSGVSVKDLTLAHSRSRGGIGARLVRLGRIQEGAEFAPRGVPRRDSAEAPRHEVSAG